MMITTCIDWDSVLGKAYVISYNKRNNYTKYVNNMHKCKIC